MQTDRRSWMVHAFAALCLVGLGGCEALETAGMEPAEGVHVAARSSAIQTVAGRQAEVLPGRVLVKLVADAGEKRSFGADEETLRALKTLPFVKGVERHFEGALVPDAHKQVQGPDGKLEPLPDLTRWHRVAIDERTSVDEAMASIEKLPGVALVEPDYVRRPSVLPDASTDPLFADQWHLAASRVPEAWAHLESEGLPPGGSRDVIVAVIDTGIDLSHPDLAANLWTHPINGSHGRDVVGRDNDPADDHGHGTHVAGIIAAQAGNGRGGVGIAHNVQIMAIKAAQYSGVLASSDIAEGIYYAVSNGADVINMSFGGYGRSAIEEDALQVAFAQAVLVAAAGNDGIPNDPACDPLRARVMYPAGYNWVLGVMASGPDGGKAGFSNWDCIARDTKEYELMAPGAGIWSTLPGGQYAAWSGTSMAAPVVSGIAALLRTKFDDRVAYPSRFIMGQLAATGPVQQAFTQPGGESFAYHTADARAALTTTPAPRLSFLQSWVFDPESLAPANNGNGSVDAGETIDLAVVIRNHWGRAEDVTVTLEPWADGAVMPDPYVTMIVDTVHYGAVGSFASDDNGLIRDGHGVITGVSQPFRFSVSAAAPNGHVIPFRATLNGQSGFGSAGTSSYTTTSSFELVVTNGRVLPRIISSDMTLTNESLWIIAHPVLIEEGVTLRMDPGAVVQFTMRDPASAYQQVEIPFLHVNGTLVIEGSAEEPVRLRATGACQLLPSFSSHYEICPAVRIRNHGTAEIRFAWITDPLVGYDFIYYTIFEAPIDVIENVSFDAVDRGAAVAQTWGIAAGYMRNARLQKLRYGFSDSAMRSPLRVHVVEQALFEEMSSSTQLDSFGVGVLRGSVLAGRLELSVSAAYTNQPRVMQRNAFLSRFSEPDPYTWTSIRARYRDAECRGDAVTLPIGDNYWGTTDTGLIDIVIHDYLDNFACPRINYQPILTTAPEDAYPFVADVSLADGAGNPTDTVGAETATFTVTFNRDMDPSVQPQVHFGPSEPWTDHTVVGDWESPRTWVGTYSFNAMTGDGEQRIRVAGARAADDAWLVTGNDVGRFRFEVLTSGSASMNLQAVGGEGYVDLSWTQDEFDLLAGFNLYRATSVEGPFTRVNPTLVPAQTRAFRDTSVAPGRPYFYQFVVVKTDMTESQPSNVATATPIDTIPPVISHAPVTTAPPGMSLSLSAQVTDNVAVQGVSLHHRRLGTSTYTVVPMHRTTGNTYTATIPGSALVSPGLEYFLSATDGISTVSAGRPEFPYQVQVVDRPVITSLSPRTGPASGGTPVTISGTNFKPGSTVTFGGAVASNVVVVSSSQITCTTPAHFPVAVDVAVTDSAGQTGRLLRGFTYESDVASLSLPTITAGRNALIQVPVLAASVDGLVAAELTVTYDPAILAARGGRTGTLTPGWSLAANTATPGHVQLTLASAGGPVAGGGVLAYIDFEVIGAPSTASYLTVAHVLLNDGAIPASTADGSVAVEAVSSVSGAVTLWSNGAPIPGAMLTLAGERLHAAESDAGGSYTIHGVPPGDYTLRAEKSDGATGISAYDASLVLQHAAGLQTLTGAAAVAADVDRSGTIGAMDAFYILQRAAGLISLPFPGAGAVWEFTPATRSLTNLTTSRTGQDFVGILLGDPSGNQAGGAVALLGGAMPQLLLSETPPSADGRVVATIDLAPGGEEVFSLDLPLRYDTALGTPLHVELGEGLSSWMMTSNPNEPGELRISMAGASPVRLDATFVTVVFETRNGAAQVGLSVAEASINERLRPDVSYRPTIEHAIVAAKLASGVVPTLPSSLDRYDVAPLTRGTPALDGLVDVEDVAVLLHQAAGRL